MLFSIPFFVFDLPKLVKTMILKNIWNWFHIAYSVPNRCAYLKSFHVMWHSDPKSIGFLWLCYFKLIFALKFCCFFNSFHVWRATYLYLFTGHTVLLHICLPFLFYQKNWVKRVKCAPKDLLWHLQTIVSLFRTKSGGEKKALLYSCTGCF